MPVDSQLERPLPSNLDAERSILGAVLLDNNSLNTAIESLKAEDFFLPQHRHVFTQMIALADAQQAIDLVTLTEELHRCGELEASGGAPISLRWSTAYPAFPTSSTMPVSSRKKPSCGT